MKKSGFITGAVVSTLCLVICKILGLVYVIPFYSIIGTQGGALYSYAYSIYSVFLNLSTVGIPAAVAKIISEYDSLNYKYLKDKAYKLASKLLNFFGVLSFIIMFLCSDMIANTIIGGVEGGNTVEEVSTAIKIVSTALLVVPKLSILKGYFQGNKFLTESGISAIVEQLIRVIVIVVGSYLIVKVFHLDVSYAVYIAVFAATIGALSSYFYLKIKARKISKEEIVITEEEKKITQKDLFKKVIFYAIPFVVIALLQSVYNVVDTFTLVKTLTNLKYSIIEAETTIGVMSTWGAKLNMIVVSMSIGITASLIPNVVGSYTKGNFKDINDKINLSFKMLLVVTVPMAIGISFLAEPVWHVFYGINKLGSDIFRIHILQVIIYGLFTTITTITQSMNQTKITIGSLILSFLIKAVLNVPMMYFFKMIGIPSYYAPTITDGIAQTVALFAVLITLKKKYNFSYKTLVPFILKVALSIIAMLAVLFIIKLFYFNNTRVIFAIITIGIYAVVGAAVYFLLAHKLKLFEEILGKNYISKIMSRLKRKSE